MLPAPIRSFAESVATKHGVPIRRVLGGSRSKSIVRARHEVWRVTRDTLDLSAPEMARIFRVDQSTIRSATMEEP